jgi:hypothetical protein
MRTLFASEKAQLAEFTDKEPDKYPEQSLRGLLMRYAIAAAFVVAAGLLDAVSSFCLFIWQTPACSIFTQTRTTLGMAFSRLRPPCSRLSR